MRYLILVMSLYLLLISGISAEPKLLVIGGDTVNWGKVRPDESPVKRKLAVKNTGNELLIFKKVTPGCGCTTAPIDKSELKPGDTAYVDITFTLPNYNGRAHKIITLYTNDPDNKNKVVHLVADVVFPLAFFPTQQFLFRGATIGDTISSRIVITNTTDEDIIIKEVKLTPEIATTTLRDNDVIPAKKNITIDVTAIPVKLGFVSGELQFKTTHPDVVRVKIPVVINVQGVKPVPEKPMKY